MSDEALRELERRYRSTGDHADEVAWLAARLRAGRLEAKNLQAAAKLGHSPAMELTGLTELPVPEERLVTDLDEPDPPAPRPWWDPRDWFRDPRTLPPFPPRRPHLGYWLREALDGVWQFELLALRAASGLVASAGRLDEERYLLAVFAALERRSARDRLLTDAPRVAPTGDISARVAALAAATSRSEDLVRDIKLRLKDGDRPAALEVAVELEQSRRAACDDLLHLAASGSIEAGKRSIRGVIVPFLLQ